MKALCRQEQLDVSFGEGEREREKNPQESSWESNLGRSDY